MRLFSRFTRREPAVSDENVTSIRERVREMRREVGRRDLELADLFALVREDERPVLREIDPVKRPDIERHWPNDIPSSRQPATEPEPQLRPQGRQWQGVPETGLFTTP